MEGHRQAALQLRQQLLGISRHRQPAVGKRAAAQVGAGAQIVEPQIRLRPQQRCVSRHQLIQSLGGAGRKTQQLQRRLLPRWGGREPGRVGEHHVRIGAAEAKRAHPQHGRSIQLGKRLQAGLHLQAQPLEIDGGIGCVAVQAGRQLPRSHAQGGLDQPGDAGGGFPMAQVGFHRTHPAGPFSGAPLAEHRSQRPQLDRVALTGARAVGLHIEAGGRGQASPGIGLAHTARLGPLTGGRQPMAPPIGIHRRAADHGLHRIAVAQRIAEPLQQHHPGTFRAHVAIGGSRKALAAAIGGQQPGLAETHLDAGVNQRLHPTGQGGIALSAPEAFAGQMHRHQGGRAGGIHREARTLQIKRVGDAVGRNATGVAREDEGLVIGGGVVGFRGPQQRAVVSAGDADEHPHRLAAQGFDRLGPVFHGTPGHLQQQPLLGIHALRFARCNAEQRRIELIDALHKSTPAHVLGERVLGIGVEMALQIPALLGHLLDRLAPFSQKRPEGLGRLDPTGQPAPHAHDGDRLARPCHESVSPSGSQRAYGARCKELPHQRWTLTQRMAGVQPGKVAMAIRAVEPAA